MVTELGCKASVFDPALYMYYKEDGSLRWDDSYTRR